MAKFMIKLPRQLTARTTLWSAGGLALVVLSALFLHHMNTPTISTPVKQARRMVTSQNSLLPGQWQYLPGATRDGNNLKITPQSFAIVNQDGSGGQANPPINLYGTHLEQATDFAVGATIADLKDSASIQLYGQVPIIADEFRIERSSVRFTLGSSSLQVQLWDGKSQTPKVTQSYPIAQAASYHLVVSHTTTSGTSGGALGISVNGKTIATLPADNLFSNQTVWFGLDGTNSWTLTHLAAEPRNKAKLTLADSATMIVPALADGLQTLATKKRAGFTLGAAMALGPLATDPDYANVALGGNFGSMTTENALKWQFVHPGRDIYNFKEADAMVSIAERHKMAIHGHTLVFGEANPRWVQDLPTATPADKAVVQKVMTDHIAKVVGHYKGKMATWDVINEPLADWDQFEAGQEFRNHKWYQAMGENYIATAFRAAHDADPNALLFMNEFGLEDDGERWDDMLALVTKLKQQGVPIDGVGFQSHIYERGDKINTGILRTHIQQLAKIGVKSRISEIDVYSEDGVETQAGQFAGVLSACLAEPTCISYTTWGISDRYDSFKDDDGSIQYGEDFLWDTNLQPTLGASRIRQILQ